MTHVFTDPKLVSNPDKMISLSAIGQSAGIRSRLIWISAIGTGAVDAFPVCFIESVDAEIAVFAGLSGIAGEAGPVSRRSKARFTMDTGLLIV